jgi:hypothetical protein
VDFAALGALQRLIEGYRLSQALYVVAKLGVADLLAHGALSSAELAVSTSTHGPSLRRVLRALASVGVFREDRDGRFGPTALSTCLRQDLPGSLRSTALLLGEAEEAYRVCGELTHTVATGEPAFDHLFGTELFQRLTADPSAGATFYNAMHVSMQRRAVGVLGAYDFSRFHSVVDVGGGDGTLLAAILAAYPHLSGVLLDVTMAIETGRAVMAAAQVSDRCELVCGNFFVDVPSGGDGYVLSSVIHDWNDRCALRILQNCRAAMASHARLLLIELVMPDQMDQTQAAQRAACADLNMLVLQRGRERTEPEHAALLAAAGFQMVRSWPTQAGHTVLESVPV